MELTKHSESPLSFHFWTGVSTIAGALRRRAWIEEGYFQWTPNFYIVLVGPPGIAAKSTTMKVGMKLLERVDGVHFGPTSMTWQALTQSLEEAKEMVGKKGDLEGEFIPMSCITCVISELGVFLRPEDKEFVDVITDLWDSQIGVWIRGTKTQGKTVIENPWLNVLAATTPTWLRENIPDSMIGGGLISRILFVYGDKKRHLVPYPSDFIDEKVFAKFSDLLVEDLREIASIFGRYYLTPEAKAWGKVWYKKHWGPRPIHMASDRYGGYIARKQTHIHKLAIVFAAAQRNERIITLADLQFSERMVTALENDMNRVFQSIGLSDTGKNVRELLVYLRAYKVLPRQELLKFCIVIMSQRDFKDAMETAIAAGYIKQTNEEGIPTIHFLSYGKS